MRFRSATADDLHAIISLHVSVSQQTYAGMLPVDYLAQIMPEAKARLWERRVSHGVNAAQLCLTLAEDAGTLAGFACFVFDEETEFGTYLHNLYVAPSHQGKGVARHLLAESIQTFSNERLNQPVHLLTLTQNHSARSFYTNLGGLFVEEKWNIMPHYPDVSFVRYQWRTARDLKKAALSRAPAHRE